MKKFFSIFCMLITTLMLIPGCNNKNAEYTKSDVIKSVKNIGYMTGPKMEGYQNEWCVKGSDHGFPIYDAETDTMYFVYGDTFNAESLAAQAMWRSNTMSYIENITTYDFAVRKGGMDGYMPTSPTGGALAIIEGWHMQGSMKYEESKIPRGGVVLNGNIYLWYMSVRTWRPWICNYSAVVKSSDGGNTWERLYNLTWVSSDTEYADTIHELATQSVAREASGITLTLSERVAPNFMQMSPADGHDGYVYFFGGKEGGACDIKMARVPYDDIEDFEKYQYYGGTGSDNMPVWLSGSAGLKVINDSDESYLIKRIHGVTESAGGEANTVFYNEYLGKWLMTYRLGAKILFRTSDNIYGPYSEADMILSMEDYPYPDGVTSMTRTYSGHSHEKLLRAGGKIMYIIVSVYDPYQSIWMEVTFK